MRGKLRGAAVPVWGAGITPADAGKTYMFSGFSERARDHPRGCGENAVHTDCIQKFQGSPPRMRGKPWLNASTSMTKGITPAGAGKTVSSSVGGLMDRDHPRRCGENLWRPRSRMVSLGSPPQVRGKLHQVKASVSSCGITPAGAGKTLGRGAKPNAPQDHPRRCGENSLHMLPSIHTLGSPPQVRGKPAAVWAHTALRRITPAGAGKTIPLPPLPRRRWDHPRRCGENPPPRNFSQS